MDIKTIGVIGAGQMGNGIAHVSAAAGLNVVMQDLEQSFVDRGLATIDKNLQRGVDKGKLSDDDKQQILGRITGTTNLESFAACDLVIEAAVEDESIKLDLFRKLDRIVPVDKRQLLGSQLPRRLAVEKLAERRFQTSGDKSHEFAPAAATRSAAIRRKNRVAAFGRKGGAMSGFVSSSK